MFKMEVQVNVKTEQSPKDDKLFKGQPRSPMMTDWSVFSYILFHLINNAVKHG